jgi:hypothetical protein
MFYHWTIEACRQLIHDAGFGVKIPVGGKIQDKLFPNKNYMKTDRAQGLFLGLYVIKCTE